MLIAMLVLTCLLTISMLIVGIRRQISELFAIVIGLFVLFANLTNNILIILVLCGVA